MVWGLGFRVWSFRVSGFRLIGFLLGAVVALGV